MYDRCKKKSLTIIKGKHSSMTAKNIKGIGGKGLLTDKKVKIIQGHYGAEIRNHPVTQLL